MKLSRRISILTLSVLATASMLSPCLGLCEDQLDSQMHSAVSKKVQQDHEADVSSGKLNSKGGRQPASVQNEGSATLISAPAAAAHPTQVQQLQKKKAAPAAPVTSSKPPVSGGSH
jgi:hypothetical protein